MSVVVVSFHKNSPSRQIYDGPSRLAYSKVLLCGRGTASAALLHREQNYNFKGADSYLNAILVLSVLRLIFWPLIISSHRS
jgi:hypothetical protein